MTNKVKAAIALAERGYRVFPLAINGKVPAMDGNWRVLATTDPERIRQLWTCPVFGDPINYNVGIAVDRRTVVLDVDVRDGKRGDRNFAAWEAINGDLPATYEVRTASGGRHLYFACEDSAGFPRELVANVDIKGFGGFVVGPGSEIDGKPYVRMGQGRTAVSLPESIAGLAGRVSRDRKVISGQTFSAVVLVDPDTPAAVSRATEWLEHSAPNHGTYSVAAKVKDFGISEETCLELLMEHWPPAAAKGTEHVAFRVANAYQYGQNAVGIASAEAEFEAVAIDQKPAGIFAAFRPIDAHPLAALPPRDWVCGKLLARRHLTLFIAPPGTGKSTFCVNVGLSVATGRDDITGLAIPVRRRVALWNQEDDADETARRVHAAMRHFEMKPGDAHIDGRPGFVFASGVERALLLAIVQDDRVRRTQHARELVAWLKANDIGVLILDPLIELHSANENDNVAMGHVARELRRIAVEADCAVMVVHHTRKAPTAANRESLAGDMDGGRGASAVAGVARIVATLYGLDAAAAARYGVPEAERHRYVRMDDAKANMSLASGEPVFFYRESVRLDAGEETVGVLRRVTLKRTASAKETHAQEEAAIRAAVAEMLAERPDGKATAAEAAEELIAVGVVASVTVDSLRKRIGAMFPEDGRPVRARKERVAGRKGNAIMLTLDNDET